MAEAERRDRAGGVVAADARASAAPGRSARATRLARRPLCSPTRARIPAARPRRGIPRGDEADHGVARGGDRCGGEVARLVMLSDVEAEAIVRELRRRGVRLWLAQGQHDTVK